MFTQRIVLQSQPKIQMRHWKCLYLITDYVGILMWSVLVLMQLQKVTTRGQQKPYVRMYLFKCSILVILSTRTKVFFFFFLILKWYLNSCVYIMVVFCSPIVLLSKIFTFKYSSPHQCFGSLIYLVDFSLKHLKFFPSPLTALNNLFTFRHIRK